MLEKHEVVQWQPQKASDVQLEMSVAEQAAFTQERDITVVGEQLDPTPAADVGNKDKTPQPDVKEKDQQPDYDSLKAIGYLLFNLKPLTGLLISFLNGFIVSGGTFTTHFH